MMRPAETPAVFLCALATASPCRSRGANTTELEAIYVVARMLLSQRSRGVTVLARVAGGNRNRDIADQRFISEETVKIHMKHIMEKLGANDRTQAVAIAIRRGIIQL
jgi:DNA-binding NarL/FixJ family response regulator